MKREHGFTLVEVMLVILLGIIMAGVVLPSPHSLDDQRITGVARVMESDLEFAQARAIATGQNHRVLFSLGGDDLLSSYQVESPPGVVIEEPLSRKPWVRNFESGTDIVSANFDGQLAVIFDGSGQPSAGGAVLLRLVEFDATVTIASVTGEVTLELP